MNRHRLDIAGRIVTVITTAILTLGGHEPAGAEQLERPQLLTKVSYGDDCSEEQRQFLADAMVYGRVAAASRAFEECVDTEVRANYRKCNGDPWYDSSIDEQIERVIAVSRSVNETHMSCTGGEAGNAVAFVGEYGHTDAENLFWGGWLYGDNGVVKQIGRRLCGSGEDPGRDNCRFAAHPWPYSQVAGIVWHEVMHTHGYDHGADNRDPKCGYLGDPSWDFQWNTMPYILGGCINRVIDESGANCDLDGCPGENQVEMVDGYGSQTCECLNDPAKKGLGILSIESPGAAEPISLVDQAILPHGDWAGAWHYDNNAVVGAGDFDGDGRDEIVVVSGWGMGIIGHDQTGWHSLMVAQNGTHFGGRGRGWTYDSNTQRIRRIADFDGNGRADILVTGDAGMAILKFKPAQRSLRTMVSKPNGTFFGGWNFDSTNAIAEVGDFNGDGKADLVVTSDWGFGILTKRRSTLRALVVAPNQTRFGSWHLGVAKQEIRRAGDFDGDGRTDLLVVSDWGIGVLKYERGTGLGALVTRPNGWFGGWSFDSRTDWIRAIGDVNGDGRDDVVVTSGWGIGVLTHDGSSSFTSLVAKPSGTWFGGWNFSVRNTGVAAGDVTGDGRADLVVRSGWGRGVLALSGSTFDLVDAVAYGTLAGRWLLDEEDGVSLLADFDGDGARDLLITGFDWSITHP